MSEMKFPTHEQNYYGPIKEATYSSTTTTPLLSEAEVWLRLYTSILTAGIQYVETGASKADEALEEYKKRYSKDE